MPEKSNTKEDWDEQWEKLDRSLFGKICSLHRRLFISRSVAYILEKYFPRQGRFVEAGCGTGESSARINRHERELIPMDISDHILKIKMPKNFSAPVIGDIKKMPFEDDSLDGIWNLGVMEHFTEDDIISILNEFYRTMKRGAYSILFIPPVFGSSELFLGTIEKVINFFRSNKKKKFRFMTDEISRVSSKKQIKELVNKSRLRFYGSHFTLRDLFTYYIVVCKKE